MRHRSQIGTRPQLRVLVVEDSFYIAEDIARVLEQDGWTVIGPAPDLKQARALLDEDPPDAALLDINLAGEMVYGFVDELRRRAIPFLFVSGYGRETVPAAYADVPHVEKPFRAANLVLALRAVGLPRAAPLPCHDSQTGD